MIDVNEHVTSQLTDYALGLLQDDKKQEVHGHLLNCESCRQALNEDRELARKVSQTLSIVTTPDLRRLAALRPDVPTARRLIAGNREARRNQVIVALTCLVLIIVGISVQIELGQDAILTVSPTMNSQTATSTKQPALTYVATVIPPPISEKLVRTPDAPNIELNPRPAMIPIPIAPFN